MRPLRLAYINGICWIGSSSYISWEYLNWFLACFHNHNPSFKIFRPWQKKHPDLVCLKLTKICIKTKSSKTINWPFWVIISTKTECHTCCCVLHGNLSFHLVNSFPKAALSEVFSACYSSAMSLKPLCL